MTKRLKTLLIVLFSVIMSVCLIICAACVSPDSDKPNDPNDPNNPNSPDETVTAGTVAHDTVAVHDPSIVIAYEDADGKTHAKKEDENAEYKKVYYVFGTQLSFAKSYDLINWKPFEVNLHNSATLMSLLSKEAAYSKHKTSDALKEN